jgi:hypothetical protein
VVVTGSSDPPGTLRAARGDLDAPRLSRHRPGARGSACPALLGFGEQAGERLDGAFFFLGVIGR